VHKIRYKHRQKFVASLKFDFFRIQRLLLEYGW